MVLRQGGDLAQVETFYSPQKGPGNCTRPLPSASKAENWPCELFLAARPLRQLQAVTVGGGIAVLSVSVARANVLGNLGLQGSTLQSRRRPWVDPRRHRVGAGPLEG